MWDLGFIQYTLSRPTLLGLVCRKYENMVGTWPDNRFRIDSDTILDLVVLRFRDPTQPYKTGLSAPHPGPICYKGLYNFFGNF